MLLGLTILLVLLAWTLGNTITHSTNMFLLKLRTQQTLRRKADLSLFEVSRSGHSCSSGLMIALLRRIESQIAVAIASPHGGKVAMQVATASRLSGSFKSLIGRNFVWFCNQQDYRAQRFV